MKNRFTTICDPDATRQARHSGFTLVELLVVVALIALLALVAIPSFMGMFSSGAETQSYNAVSALLNSGRAHAMKTGNYVAVHFQPGDPNGFPPDDNCYAAIMVYDAATQKFMNPSPIGGFAPIALPKGVGVGQVTADYIRTNGTYYDLHDYQDTGKDSDRVLYEFMTVTVVFSPQGTVVSNVNGQDIAFSSSYFLYSWYCSNSKCPKHDCPNIQPYGVRDCPNILYVGGLPTTGCPTHDCGVAKECLSPPYPGCIDCVNSAGPTCPVHTHVCPRHNESSCPHITYGSDSNPVSGCPTHNCGASDCLDPNCSNCGPTYACPDHANTCPRHKCTNHRPDFPNGPIYVVEDKNVCPLCGSLPDRKWLWHIPRYLPGTQPSGARALTIFNRNKIEPFTPARRAEYLKDNAPYLPVNSYTGQLFPR